MTESLFNAFLLIPLKIITTILLIRTANLYVLYLFYLFKHEQWEKNEGTMFLCSKDIFLF